MRGDTPIRRYIADCVILRRELTHAVEDLKFRQQGGRICYAVDFSEIYAYAVTGGSAPQFGILGDDERVAEAMQSVAFNRLFFGEAERLVLLKPYFMELQAFLLRERERTRNDAMEHLLTLQREQDAILRKIEFAEIERIVDAADLETRELTEDEQDSLTTFLENHAGPLVALANASTTHSAVLVRRLFAAKRFQNLDDLLPGFRAEDGEFEQRVYGVLRDMRSGKPEASSWLDAVAVGLLRRANETLAGHKTRLHLVTRSWAMLDLTSRPGYSSSLAFLRHPRIFSVLYTTDGMPIQQALQKLQSRLDTVTLFLNSVQMQDLEKMEHLPNPVFLTKLLEKIQDDWRASTALAASLATGTLSSSAARFPPERSQGIARQPDSIRRLFSLIRDRKQFRDLLFDRIGKMEATLERDHELFGLYLSSLDPGETETIAAGWAPEHYEGKSVLRTTSQAMPYSLQFYTDDARELLSYLEPQGGTYQWGKVLDFFRLGFSADSDYERLLAMAFILGVLSKWEIAEKYCERALEVAEENVMSAHEGLFFLSVCMRKHHPSPKRYVRALQLLDKAAETKYRWKQQITGGDDAVADGTELDPRYLKEKGTQILLINIYHKDQVTHLGVPPASEGLELLYQAEAHCTDDDKLRLQIVNNRLWYRIETMAATEPGANPHLEADYLTLLTLQHSTEPDISTWSASVLDTLAWTRYLTYGLRDSDDASEVVRMLSRAVNSHELEKSEKRRIDARLRTVRRAARRFSSAIPGPG